MEQVGFIVIGLVIGFGIMKAALAFIAWIEKQEKK